MIFQPDSFVSAAEIAAPHDVRDILRAFAKSARKGRDANSVYPRRNEMMAMLTDARACIDRINAA